MTVETVTRTVGKVWARFRVVLLFLMGMAVVEGLVASQRELWQSYDPDDYQIKVHECRRSPRDAIFIGGSPVCEGIDPALLVGMSWQGQPIASAYNLGLSGATTSEVWHAVKHGIGTPPRLLVYGITASDLNEARDEPHGPRSLLEPRDVVDWVQVRPHTAEWCMRHFALGRLNRAWSLFSHRNAIRLCAADAVETRFPGSCPEAAVEAREGLRYSAALSQGDGFAPRPEFQAGSLTLLRTAGQVPAQFPFLEKYHLGGHVTYLTRILEWAATRGVDMVLVDMPVSAELEETRFPEAFAIYQKALEDLERARAAIVLRPTRRSLQLTDDDFADLIHLNASGTRKLSYWLREELVRHSLPLSGPFHEIASRRSPR